MVKSLSELAKKGYTLNFKVNDDGVLEDGNGRIFMAKEVQLDQMQCFDLTGVANDAKVLYALHTNSGLKGRLVNGLYANESEQISEFMNQVK